MTDETKQLLLQSQQYMKMKVVYGYDQILIICKQTPEELKKLLTGDVIDELKKLSSTFQILGQVSDEAWKFGYRSLVNLVNPSKRCLRILRKNQKYLKRYAIIRVELAQDVPIHSLDHGDLYTEMLNRITCKRWGKENYCYRQEEHEQEHLPQPPVAANFQPPSFLYL